MGMIQNTINTALLASAAAFKMGGGAEIASVHKAKRALGKAQKNASVEVDPEQIDQLERHYVEALFKAGEATGNYDYTKEALHRQEHLYSRQQEFDAAKAGVANNRVMETAQAKVEQKEELDKRRELLKEQISFGKGSKGTLGDLRPELRDRILAQLEEEENGNK